MTEEGKYIYDQEIIKLQKKSLIEPSNYALLSKLAFAFNIRSMNEDALSAAKKSIGIKSNNPDGWYEYITATAFAREGELEEILELCQKMITEHPHKSWTYRNLALLYYYLEEFDKIDETCQKALSLDTSDEAIFRILGYFYYAQQDYAQAKKYLQQSIKIKSHNPRSLWVLGHCFLEESDVERACQYYKKSVKQEQFFIFSWNTLGRLYLNQEGGTLKALQCFFKALSINPRFWQTYFTLADYYLGNKRYSEAMSQYLNMLNLNPEMWVKAECHTSLGLLFTQMNQPKKAYYHLHQAIKSDENWAMAYHHLGSLYLNEKKYRKAEENFKRAIDLEPNFVWAHARMGFAYLEQNELDKAKKYFKQALKLDKEEYWAHMGLADIYRKENSTKEQLQESLKALEIAPDDSDVRNYVGIAYECNKQYEEAIAQYNKALELDPYNRGAANNLGFIYEKLIKKNPSKQLKKKAIEAWKKRLLICRDTSHSIQGAINHLKKLGVQNSSIEKWLETEKLLSPE